MASECPICNSPLADGDSSCSACGYKLLGSTEKFQPIRTTVELPQEEQASHRYDLRIIRGPQTGIDIELKRGSQTVGRDPRCSIFLNDMTVSRDHAIIEVGPTGCVIRDQNSVNGVWVNDRLVEASELKPGDIIQIGAFCLAYRQRP